MTHMELLYLSPKSVSAVVPDPFGITSGGLRYSEITLFFTLTATSPTPAQLHCDICSVTKCILVELISCHIMTPTVNSLDSKYVLKASLQLYLHHVIAPTTLHPSVEDISTGGADEGCFSLERVEMTCGHVVVVVLLSV